MAGGSLTAKWCFTIRHFQHVGAPHFFKDSMHFLAYGIIEEPDGRLLLRGYVQFRRPMKHPANKYGIYFRRAEWFPYCPVDDTTNPHIVEELRAIGDTYKEFGEEAVTQSAQQYEDIKMRRYADAWVAAKEGRFHDIPMDLKTKHYQTYMILLNSQAKDEVESKCILA